MNTTKSTILSALYIALTAFIIAFFFPREGKFRYQFNEGKPWRYGLLTAPSDFPIYKEASEIEATKDSIQRRFEPYFRFNPEEENKRRDSWNYHKAQLHEAGVPLSSLRYIDKSLNDIYGKGIAPTADLEMMRKENRARVHVLTNSIAENRNLSDFYSVKSAYEEIINNAPEYIDREVLRDCNINEYLTENLFYDAETSSKILNDLLQNIPLSSGIIQAGERIVDKGEIIDAHTYSVLRSLKTIHETKSGGAHRQNIILIGQFVLIFGIFVCFALYFVTFNPKIFYKRKNLTFILLCILAPCLLAEFCAKYAPVINIYILPFAIIPIVIRTFFDSHTALFTYLITVLICSLTALFPHEFLLLQTLAGIVVIFSLKELSQRSQLFKCSLFVWLSYIVFYLSLALYQEGDFQKINWEMMLYFGINFFLMMFSYVLIYMLEKMFGYISPITLVELSNINSPLLKKLSETAPGTFQHSMQVSILASEAGEKIGADTQLIRTGALYHDIGKMVNPAFFTENQKGFNPHDKLSNEQSAQIIISHVTEGVKMAEKAMLPKAIINFITTHHGKGITKYFYNSFKNAYPDKPINEAAFTYPGPNPFSKETALLMMADSVEAASRSLKEYTDESIKELVNRISDGQIKDGLLKNAPLTFKDIEIVKDVFVKRLKTMYHTRISYPELQNGNEKKTPDTAVATTPTDAPAT